MEKDNARFQAMQMNLNESQTIAIKNLTSKLERLEHNFEELVEDFVEHINEEEDDDDGKGFKSQTVKLSGIGRFKI